jgi:hypothetical protein
VGCRPLLPPSPPRLLQGPRGELQRTFHPLVVIAQEGQVVKVTRAEEGRVANQQHGLARTLLNNMVVGVDTGFTTTLSVSERAPMGGVHAGLHMQMGWPAGAAAAVQPAVWADRSLGCLAGGMQQAAALLLIGESTLDTSPP